MEDGHKTKEQLINELAELRQRIAALEALETERKRAEEALRESEARYRAIVEDQTELICRFLPGGTLTFVNEAYCRYFGKKREDLIGHCFIPLIPEEDQEMVRQQFTSLSPENPVVTYEHRVIASNGEIRWQQWTDRAIFDEQGHFIEFQSVGRDITERKQAEEALRRERDLAEALEEAIAALTATLDFDQVLDCILEQVGRIVPNDATNIMLIEGDQVRVVRWRGYERFGTEELVSTVVFRIPEVSNLQQILENGEPMVIPDTATYPGWVPMQEWLRSCATAPIVVRGEVIGFLNVDSATPGFFTQAHAKALRAFADHAAAAIENAKLYEAAQQEITERKLAEEEIEQRNRELAALNAIATTMMESALGLDEVLQRIADGVVEGLGCNTAVILLLDEKEGVFKGTAVSTRGKTIERINALIGSPLIQIKFPARRDLNEAVGNTLDGQITIKHNLYELVGPALSRPVCSALQGLLGSRTFLGLPLLARGKVVGGIFASTREELSEEDTETMMTFANQAAIAIENAHLYEETQQRALEQKALREAALALTTALDRDEVVERILAQLQQVVPYDNASVQLLQGDRLVIIGGRGFPNLEELLGISFPVNGDNPNREVVRTLSPFILEDALAVYDGFRREPHARANIRSFLGVPMLVGEQLVGMIALGKCQPGFYTEEHARLAQAFAAQAAIAIENARLFDETKERAESLSALYEIGKEINTALELDRILEVMCDEAMRATRAAVADVALVDFEQGIWEMRAIRGFTRDWKGRKFGLDVGIHGRVARTGEPAIIPDVSQEEGYLVGDPRIRSELAVPIFLEGKVAGMVNLESTKLSAFDEDDLRFVQALADQAAIALRNARLFEEEERRVAQLRTIGEVGRDIASVLNLDKLLHRVVNLLVDVFGHYYANVLMVDEKAQEIVLTATAGQTGRAFESLRLKISEQGITSWVAGRGEPLLVNDVDKEPRYYFAEEVADTKSELAVPIKLKGEVIGVLDVQSNEPGAFDEMDLSILTTLADQLAVAIENARLCQETKRLAITDGLTGLYNRRHFYELLEREVESVKRYDGHISLIMLDIDDFKIYNDTYGHLVGDAVLRELAQLLTQDIRKLDIAARYGGDEFVILLPHTGKKEAVALAERIRTSVEEYKFWDEEMLPTGEASSRLSRTITISLGVATCPEDAVEPEALVKAADTVLLKSKKGGNRVCAYGE